MKITKESVKALDPCRDGYDWYLLDGTEDLLETLLKVNATRPDWARWLFTRLLTPKQNQRISIYSAEQVLSVFEAQFPNDKRPRLAIEAAKAVLLDDTETNRNAARAAACAATRAAAHAAARATYAAARATYAAARAARAAADAARAAAYDATYAAYAARAAAHAAHDAAQAADNAAYAARAACMLDDTAANRKAADMVGMQERIILEAVKILDNA